MTRPDAPERRALRIGVDARELAGRGTGTGRYLRQLLLHWPEPDDALLLYTQGPAPDTAPPCAGTVWRGVGPEGARGLAWQERHLPPIADADGLDVFFAPAYWCPLRLRVPRVTTVHDVSFFALPWDFTAWEGARRRLLTRLAIGVSTRLIAVSDFTRRELVRLFPSSAAHTTAIPHGADDDLPPSPPRDEARRRLGLRPRDPLVVCVGSVFNRRRLPELLAAVARLTTKHPTLRLAVVGDNRTTPRLDLAGHVASLGLSHHVQLAGFVGDETLAELYAAADAAVYLSEYEGFGLPVVEALRRGIPTLAGNRPALSEIFAGAVALAPPDDADAIARALDAVLTDPDLRRRLADAGSRLVARLRWADAARSTRAVLADAAREAR